LVRVLKAFSSPFCSVCIAAVTTALIVASFIGALFVFAGEGGGGGGGLDVSSRFVIE